jgi:hypothetical protein
VVVIGKIPWIVDGKCATKVFFFNWNTLLVLYIMLKGIFMYNLHAYLCNKNIDIKACIIRSECTHYAYILLCKQTFQIRSVLVVMYITIHFCLWEIPRNYFPLYFSKERAHTSEGYRMCLIWHDCCKCCKYLVFCSSTSAVFTAVLIMSSMIPYYPLDLKIIWSSVCQLWCMISVSYNNMFPPFVIILIWPVCFLQ